jgi:hypothetical protein
METLPEKAPEEQMNSRFDLHAKGLISLAVILMFTIALIAGQARANLPAEGSANSDFVRATELSITLDTESIQKIAALPQLVDAILALPIDVQLTINGLKLRSDSAENAGTDDASAH